MVTSGITSPAGSQERKTRESHNTGFLVCFLNPNYLLVNTKAHLIH